MIIRGFTLLSLLISFEATSAYFSQANDVHVEFINAVNKEKTSANDASSTTLEALEPFLEGVNFSAGYTPSKVVELFETWIQKFDKKYHTLVEKGQRMLVWWENHILIETHNSKESSFTLGHNEYSDLTHEEFRKRMFLGEFSAGLQSVKRRFNFAISNESLQNDAMMKLKDDIASTVTERRLEITEDAQDWVDMGLVGPVRNQGLCGACWAFSAIGSIESAMAIDKFNSMTDLEKAALQAGAKSKTDLGLVVPLSEQNLIDCDTMYEQGCNGGLMINDFDEEESKQGICSETDYPYTEDQGKCKSNMCKSVEGSIVKDHIDIVPRKTNALKEALKITPVTAAMVADDPMFQFYSSGIYSANNCGRVTKHLGDFDCLMMYDDQDTCMPDVNHGVLVVGYGKDESISSEAKGFFKVKNSWGNSWGEGGYFRLKRYDEDPADPMSNWGECAILSILSYPVME